jgi:hypothetical protein
MVKFYIFAFIFGFVCSLLPKVIGLPMLGGYMVTVVVGSVLRERKKNRFKEIPKFSLMSLL